VQAAAEPVRRLVLEAHLRVSRDKCLFGRLLAVHALRGARRLGKGGTCKPAHARLDGLGDQLNRWWSTPNFFQTDLDALPSRTTKM